MKKIEVSQNLQNKLPNFHLGVLSFKATVYQEDAIDDLIKSLEKDIKIIYQLKDILVIKKIKAARDGYKTLRKDPSRYRVAVESLYRRIVKGNSIYRINNLVDIGNVLSLKTKRSIAVLDETKIKGDIIIRIGDKEDYEGIGRGKLNIENIPVYCDELGPFGTPTSDSLRTAISNDTVQVTVFIISFDGRVDLEDDINLAMDLYKQYAKAYDFAFTII